jgi:hypothetical protein
MLPKKGKKLHPARHRDGAGVDFTELIACALRDELGSSHQAIKTVMRWTGASERTVKYWFAGTTGPSGEHLVALARNSDEILRVFLVAAERSPSLVTLKLVELRSTLLEALAAIDRQL